MGNSNHSELDTYIPLSGNPYHSENHNKMGHTPTCLFHSDGKSKPFGDRHLYFIVRKSKHSENHNEMGLTPTRPFHSDGKSRPFGVGYLYSAVWKSKPLGGDCNEMGLTPYSTFPLRSEI